MRTALGLDPADRFLFSMGRMHEFSGFVGIVRALMDLNEPQRTKMLLVGKGEVRPQLEQLASSPAAHGMVFLLD